LVPAENAFHQRKLRTNGAPKITRYPAAVTLESYGLATVFAFLAPLLRSAAARSAAAPLGPGASEDIGQIIKYKNRILTTTKVKMNDKRFLQPMARAYKGDTASFRHAYSRVVSVGNTITLEVATLSRANRHWHMESPGTEHDLVLDERHERHISIDYLSSESLS